MTMATNFAMIANDHGNNLCNDHGNNLWLLGFTHGLVFSGSLRNTDDAKECHPIGKLESWDLWQYCSWNRVHLKDIYVKGPF